ncbi:hypothetical protein, partial [Paenibacillus sp. FSL H8-0548]|uniref:hypothetical protein n=1 Tax=Paenibacillus sp. FSL H8-0548 TaxID=1920422 RepID=UPI001C4B9FEE
RRLSCTFAVTSLFLASLSCLSCTYALEWTNFGSRGTCYAVYSAAVQHRHVELEKTSRYPAKVQDSIVVG